jgi:dolichol-phosphate mannosyltransferase
MTIVAQPAQARVEAGPAPRISVVIPTFNERDNIVELLGQLRFSLPADSEILFVDDSTDDTPTVIAEYADGAGVPVRLLHRHEPEGGLGGAVVAGLKLARGTWIVVMDADLQHPPALARALVEAGEAGDADLVVASRYAAGGDRSGLAGRYRQWVSRGSTTLAKAAFPGELKAVSDPMSGFFAVRAATVDTAELRPLGYKILLELIVRTRPSRVAEVPYTFGRRFAGESKSTLREGLRYLRHLASLRLGTLRRTAGTGARMLAYGAIGLSGVLPNLAALWLLTSLFGLHYLAAAVVANQIAIGWNFALTDLLVFRDRRRGGLLARCYRFAALGNADLVLRIPLLAVLVGEVGMGYLSATVVTLGAMFLLRFTILDRLIYVRTAKPVPAVWEAS